MTRDYLEVEYDEESHPFTSYPAKLSRFLMRKFDIRPGMSLLEPGCGRAEVLAGFRANGIRCYGSDVSSYAEKFCASSKIEYRYWDVATSDCPWGRGSFDVVYSKSLIEHVDDGVSFIQRQAVLIKPGGLLLVLTPDWEANFRIFYDDFTHIRPYTRRSLRSLLSVAGDGKGGGGESIETFRFRQLPITWSFPAVNMVCGALAPFVSSHSKNTFLRWSRELMLVGAMRLRK